jgi:hypothetical protein
MPETLQHHVSVRESLTHRQPVEAQRRLARVGSKLSTIAAEILFNCNQYPLARRWYSAASRAAGEGGDRYLADIALASSAYLPTYSGDPRGVLAHVTPRLEQAVGATPAIAWLWGFAALAHAALGDRAAFERANEKSRSVLNRCSPDLLQPGIFSFLPEKQAFYEARGWADLGDVEGTGKATSRALQTYDPTDSSDPTLVRLAYACVLAKQGEIEEACRVGTEAIRDPHTLPVISVVVRAHEFDDLLKACGSATADWREALSELRPPSPAALMAHSPLGA